MPATSWTQIEKLSNSYLRKPGEATALALDKCLKRATDFTENLATYFVRKHQKLAEANVAFCMSTDGTFPDWGCQYDESTSTFVLNPIGVILFYKSCLATPVQQLQPTKLRSEKTKEEWSACRLDAYKAELRKLPSQLHLFLLLFQEIARVLEVTYVERRRPPVKQEIPKSDLDYQNFLWAFRELEGAYRYLFGGDLRINTQFTWWESEWSDKK